VAKAILETVKTFLVDFGNPIRVLVEQLVKLITTLIDSLRRSGFYAWYHVPNPLQDPNFKRFQGGFPSFVQTWKGSLLDAQDPNRPQPQKGSLTGGFVMIVADAQGPEALLEQARTILKFFGKDFTQPVYPAPANVKVVPVGAAGDPVLSITQLFKTQIESLAVEWSLPANVGSADPSFGGLPAQLSSEFYPPKWLIERSSKPPADNVDVGYIGDYNPPKVGYLTKVVNTGSIDPRTNKPITKTVRINDDTGEPVVLFENAYVVSASSNALSFVLGQLGTFRYIDKVDIDKPYFYRVRAFSGTLRMDEIHNRVDLREADVVQDARQAGLWQLKWPSAKADSVVTMGKPSAIIRGRISKVIPTFDVVEVIRSTLLAAYSLNFHIPLPPGDPVRIPSGPDAGKPVLDPDGNPVTQPQFDDNGNPIPPLDDTAIGRGTLSAISGVLGSKQFAPTVTLNGPVTGPYVPSEVTGRYPDQPWVVFSTRFQAARMTTMYASLLFQAGGGVIEAWRALMQGTLPAGKPETGGTLASVTTLEQLVTALTATEPYVKPGKKRAQPWSIQVPSDTAKTYGTAFYDPIVRKNILAAVNFLKTLGYQGVPPDWERVTLLQDVIPWSAQMLYDMLAKINALLDAYKGVMSEIKAFIDLITRKIDALENFIQFLVSILNFVESLGGGFYLLSVSGLTGDVNDWFTAIDNAGGKKPTSGQGGYTAGICIAYLATDVSSFETALKAIF
jgi:hypothetical protein